jgi:hypothetical protein
MKTLTIFLILMLSCFNVKIYAQAITLTPQGNTSSQFSLSTTLDVSQTGTPTVSQLIYNTNAGITGADANGVGYYFWNGTNWKSLDANIPQSTIIFSETHPNQSLINSGFSMIGTTQVSTPALDVWKKISTANAPLSILQSKAFLYQNKFYFLGNSINRNNAIYDPELDIWTVIDSLNAPPTLPQNYFYGYRFYKDRILVYSNNSQNISNSRIYNPNTNSWQALSLNNSPTNLNFQDENIEARNFQFIWENQSGKIFNLITNTWTDASIINAPIVPVGSYPQILHLESKILLYFSVGSNIEFHIYDIPTSTWNSVNSNNAPNIYSNVIPKLSTDSSIYFSYGYLNQYVVKFKKYSIQQNIWSEALDSLSLNQYESLGSCIGKIENKTLFSNNQSDIRVYDNNLSKWMRILKHPDDVELRTTSTPIQICGNKLIIYAGGNNNVTRIPWYNDGYMYDVTLDSWKYIPSLFGLVHESFLQPVVCCNDKFFFAFFNRQHYMANNQIVNKSGIMQLSGSTNQTTQKTLYLYKKN